MPDNLRKLRDLTISLTKNEADTIKRKAIDATTIWVNFYDILPIPICIAGVDGYFKKVNQCFCNLLGYTSEELLANTYSYFVHPDDIVGLNRESATIGTNTTTKDYSNRYRKSDGEYIELKWIAATIAEGLAICTVEIIN